MASNPASVAKEKGNAAFKAGDYPAAIGHYTTATLADPSDPTFPLNRAAAYLKLGKNEDAERDCTRVLSLSSTNVKALFRRAQARSELLRYAEARADLQAALKLEPSNASVRAELAKVDGLVSKGKSKAQAKSASIDVSVPASKEKAKAQPKPPVDANPTPAPPKRRRIPITIVEPEAKPAAAATPTSPPTSNVDLLKPVSTRPLASPSLAGTTSSPSEPAPKSAVSFKEARQARESAKPVPRAGGGIFRASGNHTLFKSDKSSSSPTTQPERPSPPPASNASNAPSVQTPTVVEGKSETTIKVPAVETSTPSGTAGVEETSTPAIDSLTFAAVGNIVTLPPPAELGASFKLPMTLFAFSRAWDSLPSPAERWTLLSQFPPSSLPMLFRMSLEPALLASLLDTFLALLPYGGAQAKGWIKAYMEALRGVERFGTVALFLSGREKEVSAMVWESVGGEGVWGR